MGPNSSSATPNSPTATRFARARGCMATTSTPICCRSRRRAGAAGRAQQCRMDCTIRTLAPHEIERVIDFAAAEGWNPGLHDAACFHAADAGGFLMAELDGAAVGCISAVSYVGRFGFIGLYIVLP